MFFNHPSYDAWYDDWFKWRLTYEGGRRFIDTYLKKFSSRESDDDFTARRCVTYCPAFAAAAVDEIKNSIYERLTDISRVGGSQTYQAACNGEEGGVDLRDASMNNFMGVKVLPELLTMRKVGIYVDMPAKRGLTKAENVGLRPYLYIYQAEQIKNWVVNSRNQCESVQLEDADYAVDPETGFPKECITRTRHLWRDENGIVHVELYQDDKIIDETLLELTQIPFVVLELPHSLLQNIADYQVALLNLESSDMISILKSNFPFYVEQGNQQADLSNFIRQGDATDPTAKTAPEETFGGNKARKYYGEKQPAFIHPSPEPLQVSMEKEEQIKSAIRQLLTLSVANLAPSKVSAASKEMDSQGLESGLAFIGEVLETGETKIAKIWAEYESTKDICKVKYPDTYSLKSTQERLADCQSLLKIAPEINSNSFRRQIHKMTVATLLSGKVQQTILDKIFTEIDSIAPISLEQLKDDVEGGLVTQSYASKLRGYPPGEAEKAADEKAQRAEDLMKAQSANSAKPITNPAARGLPDLSVDPKGDAKAEKAMSQKPENTGADRKKVRGRGR